MVKKQMSINLSQDKYDLLTIEAQKLDLSINNFVKAKVLEILNK